MDDNLKLLKTCMEHDLPDLRFLPDAGFEYYFGQGRIEAVDVKDPLSGYSYKMMTMKEPVRFGALNYANCLGRRVEWSLSYEFLKDLARNACTAWANTAPEIYQIKKHLAEVEAAKKKQAIIDAKKKTYSAVNIINEALRKVNDPKALTMYLLGAKQFYESLEESKNAK